MTDNPRQIKGLEIAARYRITNDNGTWTVPSQSGRGKYKVDPAQGRCTCPDYEYTQSKCKHQFAVEFTIEREKTTTVTEAADGTKTTTVTETVKVTRKTYPQDWPAYNEAQTKEKELFQKLLHELCKGVGEPAQFNGRPRLPLEDMIFAMAFKVYSTLSTRRFMTDLRDAHGKGYISQLPCYNSVINYFETEMLTDYLKMLIEESSLPLQAIEKDFAVDSSGLSTCRFVSWHQTKYKYQGEKGMDTSEQIIDKHDWIKVHICCGVKTNVVTAAEVSDRYAADTNYFKPLVNATAENFAMQQVSADKAYLSLSNLQTVAGHTSSPYIPFKSTSVANHKNDKTGLWKRLYHYFAYNTERFMEQYHKRSNVESTFSMVKAKFGDSLRSKTRRAQTNEALCKILCHNICCVISAIFELDITPQFWNEVAA
jgi:transposase